MPLLETLAACVDGELAREIAANGSGLTTLLARAEGEFEVGDDAWVAHFVRHLRRGEVAEQIQKMHADDVQLVLACLAGHPGALGELDARLGVVAPRALATLHLEPVVHDDVLQDVREKLLLPCGGSPPKLASYSGRGPLDAWLRVVLARAAVSALRARASEQSRREGEALLEGALSDPRIDALRQKYAPALSRAVEQAVAALPEADRAVLRMHVVDALTIDDLAVVYGAHRATMARRIARARNLVFEAARAHAMRELGIGENEFASLMGVVLSRLDVTIRRVIERT